MKKYLILGIAYAAVVVYIVINLHASIITANNPGKWIISFYYSFFLPAPYGLFKIDETKKNKLVLLVY